MKTILSLLLGSCISASVIAQTVILRFDGTRNQNYSYQVNIDGKIYNSNDFTAQSTANEGTRAQKIIKLTELDLGSHDLKVYSSSGSDDQTINTTTPAYSNTFRLRDGYDMVIAIRGNGQVSFSERRIGATTGINAKPPMADTQFEKLLQSVKNRWSQSSRITAEKAAFNNKAYNFTLEQVGQLLTLITAENRKVELAKLSYPRVTDPENFSEINELFTTKASKDQMDAFIRLKNPQSTVSNNNQYNNRPPMANAEFNQLLRRVKNQYQQSGKVALITDEFNNNTGYFTTAQLRQLLTLTTAETDRLALAKLSYARVSDVDKFSSLYNLLNTQASRNELDYYVKNGSNAVSGASTNLYSNRIAISDDEFSKLQRKALFHFRQSSTVTEVRNDFSSTTNYYSIPQIRTLLSLVDAESDRLALAKLAYNRATDPPGFTQLLDLFTTQAIKDELTNYINTNVQTR